MIWRDPNDRSDEVEENWDLLPKRVKIRGICGMYYDSIMPEKKSTYTGVQGSNTFHQQQLVSVESAELPVSIAKGAISNLQRLAGGLANQHT